VSEPVERSVTDGEPQSMRVHLFESGAHVFEPELLHTIARSVLPEEPRFGHEDERPTDVRPLARVRRSDLGPPDREHGLVGTDASAEIAFGLGEAPAQ